MHALVLSCGSGIATSVGSVICTCDLMTHQVCGCGLLCVGGKWLHPESKQVGCHLCSVLPQPMCGCVGDRGIRGKQNRGLVLDPWVVVVVCVHACVYACVDACVCLPGVGYPVYTRTYACAARSAASHCV